MSIYNQRTDYKLNLPLEESTVPKDPFEFFHEWYKVALERISKDPNAMILSTYDGETPRGRVVLLKNLDARGFTYFTNYLSDKVSETNKHEKAALTFFWSDLERQVRVEGVVEKVSEKESDDYFNNRPLGSRLGAWASPQSQVIPNRQFLENEIDRLSKELGDKVERPPHWGGLRLVPHFFEFWQGQSSRLHDRITYTLIDGNWVVNRLAP